ncbi:hypothetical protein Sa4125_10970 [Aureimonas sp. SA4125]|uniref:hypothetical protein n=1 Tax=Aureimonas sp. SA4125 TaxID=2826993 RepID=UPI001CC7773D|nr:hypothetical protein [Aureimonas sp. SA4125]BDA83555.1 hypothetical protein Sa4125_10970 [Aureimonas sp. SA4125]
MSAMEKSLRRALEAGDARDPQFRDSIYSASERALERLLRDTPADEETAYARRVLLAETINRIEADYFEPVGEPEHVGEAFEEPGDAAALQHEPIHRQEEERFIAESEDAAQAGDGVPLFWANGQQGDVLAAEVPDDDGRPAAARPSPDASEAGSGIAWSPKAGGSWRALPKSKGRLGLPGVLALAALLALLAVIYVLYGAIFAPFEQRAAAGSAAATDAAGTPAAEWINIFDGRQLDVISTPSGGTVDGVTVKDLPAVRLAPAAKGGEINVAIGPGVVSTIKGRSVRVEVVAGSSDGNAREFGIRCLFGEETACGRQRFRTEQASETFVFDMAVPAAASAAGVLAIDPQLGAETGNLDLYSVRLQSGARN